MLTKILVANRGEIALRVIRACKELGIRTVAVYSEADAQSLHVQMADEAVCIGKARSNESYLKMERIISAAEICDADGIHPGYGFLAESSHFAEICKSCHIKFIGPSPEAMALLGDKAKAKEVAKKAKVPVTPGSDGPVESEKEAVKIAKKIGFPVMIKAVAGGGGKGMRKAHNEGSFMQGFYAARTEAEKAFGNGSVYIEKLIENPHHVEFQIMGDSHGKIVHVGERDCSVQRKNQKLIEESPSPHLKSDLRKKMGRAAVKLAEAVKYENAGTIEFLVDGEDDFYFLEMNTRIQVEHPVTEMLYGVDLVKEQIRIASGEKLGKAFEDLEPNGHAIEFRINAENPFENFRPSAGKIDFCCFAGGPGVRVDSHAYSGYEIPPYYDSMIGKLIAWGPDRKTAIDRLYRALDETLISGVSTTIPLGQMILKTPAFRRGRYGTGFIEKLLEEKATILPHQA